ncbi:hypothetical protein Ccar_07430 [Clostridium carboxidivorans P7]|uniref:Uncharacterized protein n=1 Tax=Clostridium carboxidivorans P7 TaxID=536227 RepID=C6PTQ8_9CLOT|nr:hypothetical protein [Clostridium carboxidivorans]AKN30670.1 hypothetical protein Ccar_07430 [Clostridium carboxidivorans P7]EET87394.1 conserved hypothetical protein [Clostridium carboxidivorans P7]EFG86430.1 hypothetical protein CLCAR_4256 [Clostridium carboxidivorans P7]
MNKKCIFNSNKDCTNCGECDRCDLNANKKCTNCGKCLELEGYDMKAIKVDEILEDKIDTEELQQENENHYHLHDEKSECTSKEDSNLEDDKFENMDDKIEYIDDIEGLREIIEDEGAFKDLTYEEFPGLIRFKGEERE